MIYYEPDFYSNISSTNRLFLVKIFMLYSVYGRETIRKTKPKTEVFVERCTSPDFLLVFRKPIVV